jgi:hypothetical protein
MSRAGPARLTKGGSRYSRAPGAPWVQQKGAPTLSQPHRP